MTPLSIHLTDQTKNLQLGGLQPQEPKTNHLTCFNNNSQELLNPPHLVGQCIYFFLSLKNIHIILGSLIDMHNSCKLSKLWYERASYFGLFYVACGLDILAYRFSFLTLLLSNCQLEDWYSCRYGPSTEGPSHQNFPSSTAEDLLDCYFWKEKKKTELGTFFFWKKNFVLCTSLQAKQGRGHTFPQNTVGFLQFLGKSLGYHSPLRLPDGQSIYSIPLRFDSNRSYVSFWIEKLEDLYI